MRRAVKAYKCGERGWDLAKAAGKGALSGGIGALATLGMGHATGNPFLAGAGGAAVDDGLDASLGKNVKVPCRFAKRLLSSNLEHALVNTLHWKYAVDVMGRSGVSS
jgi:hypothetical protein